MLQEDGKKISNVKKVLHGGEIPIKLIFLTQIASVYVTITTSVFETVYRYLFQTTGNYKR